MTDIRSQLNNLHTLEGRERSLKADLADEESNRRFLQSALAEARNTMKGHESRKDSRPYLVAQADSERLESQLAAAEVRIAETNRQLSEARAAQNAITAGTDRAAVFALAYQDAMHQADRALMEFEEAVRKHEDATTLRDAAAARLATAEQARAQALEPDVMAQARAVVTTAQADLDDADTLLANLGRLLEERRARLQTTRATVATAHKRVWKAVRDDEIAALHADFQHLHVAFAAGVASGENGQNYEWFARDVMTASPRPADLNTLLEPLAEALGVPARLPRFAH